MADTLLEKARTSYPPGGSAAGTPSFELFCAGPLEAAKIYFEREYDSALESIPGTGIKQVHTLETFFPIMVFYALAVGDHLEIVDYVDDPDYWDLVGDDPSD